MEKVVVSLQTENRRLQTVFASTTNPSSSSSMQDSFRSVEDEVDDVLDVRYTEGQKKRYSSPQQGDSFSSLEIFDLDNAFSIKF